MAPSLKNSSESSCFTGISLKNGLFYSFSIVRYKYNEKMAALVLFVLICIQHLQAGPIGSLGGICSPDLGRVSPTGNNTCPVDTNLDEKLECCVPKKSSGEMQRDVPKKCDTDKKQWQPLDPFNACPRDTGLDERLQCCVPCRPCDQVGLEKGPSCLGNCTKCPSNYYRNQHTKHCILCVQCEALNREYVTNCSRTVPARCGFCLQGYLEEQPPYRREPEDRGMGMCQKKPSNESSIYLREMQDKDKQLEKIQNNLSTYQGISTAAFILVAILVMVVIVLVAMVYRLQREKGKQNPGNSGGPEKRGFDEARKPLNNAQPEGNERNGSNQLEEERNVSVR